MVTIFINQSMFYPINSLLQGGAILKQAKKDLIANKFDLGTGLLMGQAAFTEILTDKGLAESPLEEVQATEIDKELALIADPNNQMVGEKVL